MSSALLEFFRCPAELIETHFAGIRSSESRYFHFGSGTLCYGQTATVPERCAQPDGFPDLSGSVRVRGSNVGLPFDFSQIVENLRRERYMAGGYANQRTVLDSAIVRDTYYLFRPFMGVGFRKHLQRFALRQRKQASFPQWPVDTTVERLMERLLIQSMRARGLDEMPFIWFWPDGASSCAIVTHDVETKAGLGFIPTLIDLNMSYAVSSSFQIVPRRYKVPQAILDRIRGAGCELNVHDLSHDGTLFRSRKDVLRGAPLVNAYLRKYGAAGFRSGQLYRNADWFDAFEMSYDMSIPNTARLEPQSGGCCTVFPYFIGSVLELPLTTSEDYSLFHILGDYSIGLWKRQIALIRARRGLISVLVHPDYVYNNSKGLSAYRMLLDDLVHLREVHDLWIATPGEVNRWWRERSQMRLVSANGSWRIHGQGHARARIAFVRVERNRAVYCVEGQRELCTPLRHAEHATVSVPGAVGGA